MVLKLLILSTLILNLWSFESDTSVLEDYKVIDHDGLFNGESIKAIRSWERENQRYYLVVNTATLKTQIVTVLPKSLGKKESVFERLKHSLLLKPSKLHNFGITTPDNDGDYLTIDMCPSSKKGYEKKLFTFLEKSGSVANISISGKWMLGHPHDFDALIKSALKVRWINHSFSHYYDHKEKDWAKNFMLKNPDAFDAEIIKTEKLLIINHQTPSVFFRFPGLISDKKLIDKLIKTYNLLPLGTNNWLNVSNKKIEKGEIILVHGNKNEHRGIKLFFDQNQSDKYYAPIEAIILKQ